MHRTFLSLAVAALAGFATAVHADDGAAPRSTVALPHAAQSPHSEIIVAELHGKGEVGKACHASYNTTQIYTGTYALDGGELVCQHSGTKVYCHPEDRPSTYSQHSHCYDGNKS